MLPTGLQLDRKSGVYYVRRRIPSDILICYPGKKEYVFSLKTKDYRTALKQHRLAEAKLTAEWSEHRQRLADQESRRHAQMITRIDSLTPEVIETICKHAEAATLASDEQRRESEDPYTAEELEFSKAGYAEANRMLKQAVGEGNQDILRPLVEQYLYLCGYLAVMTPFIRHCKLRWQVRGWPPSLTTDGVEYMGSRKDPENGQRSFKPTELKRLFSGPELATFAQNVDHAHKYWLPTVALFTGARVNELCQLNPQCDIKQDAESKHWFLDITAETTAHKAVKKTVKTPGSKRKVPIHPQLIELGFLQYVERIKALGHTLLFPGFPPSVGKASPKAGEWFIDFMRDLGLRDETPKARLVGMHAFRSTLMNRAMVLRVVGIEAITGHANKVTKLERVIDGQVEGARSDVVVGYQGELPIDQKMEILERINYGDLTFHRPVTV